MTDNPEPTALWPKDAAIVDDIAKHGASHDKVYEMLRIIRKLDARLVEAEADKNRLERLWRETTHEAMRSEDNARGLATALETARKRADEAEAKLAKIVASSPCTVMVERKNMRPHFCGILPGWHKDDIEGHPYQMPWWVAESVG